MRIVLTGGGTGGHIYPALAIGREAERRDPASELLYIGTKRGLESRIVPERGVRFESIDITGIRRSLSLENVRTALRFVRGVRRAKSLLREFRPDAVVGTGGYVCGPVVYAAAKLGIPTLLHEQNVVPGLTNKFLSRYADAVAVSFADSKPHFARVKSVEYAGNPCATAILGGDPIRGYASLGLSPGTRFVLIVGGSRGAQTLNRAAAEAAAKLGGLPDVHFVFASGERYYEELKAEIDRISDPSVASRLHVKSYISNMAEVLAATSLVVGRAGASFIAEFAALGVPAIYVPSPNVTNNHQQANAESVVRVGGGTMILERELTGAKLYEAVAGIMGDEPRRVKMAEAAKSIGMPEAAGVIYDQLERIVRRART